MPKVNYVISLFIGKRRNKTIKPTDMVRKHLDYLQDNNIPVDKVTIVLNLQTPKVYQILREEIQDYNDYYTNLKVLLRRNGGFSYAAWNDAIISSIHNGEEFTHYFLVEDDYIPGRTDFLDVFMQPMKDNVGYVCQKVFDLPPTPRHAAMSCGLLSGEVAREIHSKYARVFEVNEDTEYERGEANQVLFLMLMENCGYKFVDCSDIASMPFFEKWPDRKGEIIEYGNPDFPPALVPITGNMV